MTEVVKEEAKAPPAPVEEKKASVELFPEVQEEVDEEKKERREDISRILTQLTREGEHAILAEDFPTVLRALDQDPTDKEIEEYLATYAKYDQNNKHTIDHAAIHEIVEKRMRDPDTEEALLDAFNKLLDKDGKLSNAEFIHYMITRGDPLDEEIVKSYIQYADQDKDGYVEVENFVKLLMSGKK